MTQETTTKRPMPTIPASPETQPLVHVIIINWNQPQMMNECLDSLARTKYAPMEVIVVDNGSTDDSVRLISKAHPDVVILEAGHNLGYSKGNNVGIEWSLAHGAEYILLLNNDTIVDPAMLERLVTAASDDPEAGIVGPTQFYFDEPDTIWGAANYVVWAAGEMSRAQMGRRLNENGEEAGNRKPVSAHYIDTCAALVRRDVFERAGLMDERYFINFDDADLGLRARRAGFNVVHVPEARMWHKVSASMGVASPATTYYMTRNLLLLFWTHGRGAARFLAVSRIFLRTLRSIAAWTMKSQYKEEIWRRRRAANLYALRDFLLRRFGKMGPDVALVCYGNR